MRADLLRFKCQEGFTRMLAAAATTVFMGVHVVRGRRRVKQHWYEPPTTPLPVNKLPP